ncbi:PadR family transcriptional regulator [Allosaccharopolyspora coralli]|uniref:PadR family transcriptional regulator n=1 Tax=Allosaccharopolyspora coralli TaxID=2665642 RepID=A0A5Q3QBI0_9PSEU|nr:PadR family transcriptional regulator [Allosaccharopolyspora coralli]QGK71733.1 PadR family transcriptional regulator [Allosaccharopolyspora coralli]
MRSTHALIQVALALMETPSDRFWGYELTKRAGVRSGVLYPMLTRMLDDGWLVDGWEDSASIQGKRPPRRYYELTDKGRRELGGLLQGARDDARFSGMIGRLAW